YTHSGEFILVAEDGANDLTNYPVKYINGEAWINNHAHVISNKQGITNTKFLIYRFRMFNYIPFLVGGSRAKLNASSLLKLKMKIPVIEEQEKISHLLYRLENMITLHKRKNDALYDLRESYVNSFYINKNLKLKNFDKKWEVYKLSEIASYRRGSFPQPYGNPEWYDEEGMPFVQVVDVGDNFRLATTTKQHISLKAQPKSVFAPRGSVVITLQGSIGR